MSDDEHRFCIDCGCALEYSETNICKPCLQNEEGIVEGQTMSEQPVEYTDEQTGVRLTVETEFPHDPDWPHLTVYPPEQCMLTTEEMKDAVKRLVRRAGYDESLHKWVTER